MKTTAAPVTRCRSQHLMRHRKADPPSISVTVTYEGKERIAGPFTSSFRIGRDDACDVALPVHEISRQHVEIFHENDCWWLKDLGSSNGTFFRGERIERHAIEGTETFQLAANGPLVRFALSEGFSARASTTTKRSTPLPPSGAADKSLDDYKAHYLSDASDRPAGEHTMMIRRAFKTVQAEEKKKHSRVLQIVVGSAVVIIAVVFVLLIRSEQRLREGERQLANFLSQIRQMELDISNLRAENPGLDLSQQTARLRQMSELYDATIVEYGVRRRLNDEERLIYRMAVVFRESESEIPPGFVRAVKETIHDFWLRPGNLRTFREGVQRAQEKGYAGYIVEQLKRSGLPPDFFYLALQESVLDPTAVASRNTRWGWAKGMWQFIPDTGERYDLQRGPMWQEDAYDPADERHDFEKSTVAAAQYMSEIYRTLAQASGLLVMASYNWGEFAVRNKLDEFPDPDAFQGMEMTPESRSYWRFYSEYEDRIPDETRNYVLRIFSLAVIGSDPRFFGIDMDDPLHAYR